MQFITERLILRAWEESDAESLYKYAKDPKVGPIAGWPIHTSVENSLEIIKDVLSAPETYAVCLKEDNIAIGSIGLILPAQSHMKALDNEMEIGYWIGVPFWGNGYIPEAIKMIQKHAFENLGCSALWCGYYDGNEKSKRCQEKCGFVYNHTEENKMCELMNEVRVEHFSKITKEQWKMTLSHKEKALAYFKDKFHCSQAVLAAFSDECGITEEQALKLGACFGSGMRKGEVCGSCTGALMVLGLLYGQYDKTDLKSRQTANKVNDKMMERFAKVCGSYICNDLLKCDISTFEGVTYALNNNLFTEFCPKMVENAVDILEGIIAEQQKNRD